MVEGRKTRRGTPGARHAATGRLGVGLCQAAESPRVWRGADLQSLVRESRRTLPARQIRAGGENTLSGFRARRRMEEWNNPHDDKIPGPYSAAHPALRRT